MAAYRRVYDSPQLQADCQETGSAPEPYPVVRPRRSTRAMQIIGVWATFLYFFSMQSRVYVTVRCPSVSLSVPSVDSSNGRALSVVRPRRSTRAMQIIGSTKQQ